MTCPRCHYSGTIPEGEPNAGETCPKCDGSGLLCSRCRCPSETDLCTQCAEREEAEAAEAARQQAEAEAENPPGMTGSLCPCSFSHPAHDQCEGIPFQP